MCFNKCIILSGIVSLCVMYGCTDSSSNERIATLEHERDSMMTIAREKDSQLDQINCFFDSISHCIDSITAQEQVLLNLVDPETNRYYSKREMRERLALLSEIITRQRERIRILSDSLNMINPENYASLTNMVIYLSEQLEQKKTKINQLSADIETKNRSIRQLTNDLNMTKDQLSDAVTKNEILSDAVVEQSTILNETYILIGDKDKFKSLGVLTGGGLFKKMNYNPSAINLSNCQKVDIRQFKELPINSSKPKILSAVPDNSYHWQPDGNGNKILVIDNATSFWSLSNILVIQL